MSSTFDHYYGTLLADVGYVDFDPIGLGEVLGGETLEEQLAAGGRFSCCMNKRGNR